MIRKMFLTAMAVSLALLSAISAFGQVEYLRDNPNAADTKEYRKIENALCKGYNEPPVNSKNNFDGFIKQKARSEREKNKYRDKCIRFWVKYPKSPLRFALFSTMYQPHGPAFTNFWEGIKAGTIAKEKAGWGMAYSSPVNWKFVNKWEKIYPRMRAEYVEHIRGYSDQAEKERAINNFYCSEIKELLQLSLNIEYRKNRNLDLGRIKELFLESGILQCGASESCQASFLLNTNFIDYYQQYGFSLRDLNDFVNSFKGIENMGLKTWVNKVSKVLNLYETPFEFSHTATDGRVIDLEKMRGKVVLLDFWSTGCTSCIARMPAIKEVYDKYKDSGFEVVSICLNFWGDKPEKIKAIEDKIGADWPTLLLGGFTEKEYYSSKGRKIFSEFGLKGVPQLFLFDKQGKLVVFNDMLRGSDFEPTLKALLAQK